MARTTRNYTKRAEAHCIDTLHSIVTVQQVLEEETERLVHYLRSEAGGSYSWQAIGDGLGITKQSAMARYGGEGARKPGGQPAHLRG